MSTAPADTGFRIRGRHVLFGVVGFFTVVIGVDAAFMTLAIRSFPGEVSSTPFEDGLAFNRTLAQREAQAKLGYSADVEPAAQLVRVRLTTRDGAPVTGASATATLSRPATEAGRKTLRFTETAPGVYSAPVGVLTGAWDLALTARDAQGRPFEAERRLSWSR